MIQNSDLPLSEKRKTLDKREGLFGGQQIAAAISSVAVQKLYKSPRPMPRHRDARKAAISGREVGERASTCSVKSSPLFSFAHLQIRGDLASMFKVIPDFLDFPRVNRQAFSICKVPAEIINASSV